MAERTIPTIVTLRPPSSHTLAAAKPSNAAHSPPTPEWMTGTWHVTHSTLPMWKSRYGVKITYTPLESSGTDAAVPAFDDLVEYQKSSGGKGQAWSSIRGISRTAVVDGLDSGWAFSWRGTGWLMIASSQWEILGYGRDLSGVAPGSGEQGRDWAVTYFSKTMFTPAGVDVYCRGEGGVSEECLVNIKRELAKFEELKELAGKMFEIPRK